MNQLLLVIDKQTDFLSNGWIKDISEAPPREVWLVMTQLETSWTLGSDLIAAWICFEEKRVKIIMDHQKDQSTYTGPEITLGRNQLNHWTNGDLLREAP